MAEMARESHDKAQDLSRPDGYTRMLATSMVLEHCEAHVSESQYADLNEELGVQDVTDALNISKSGSSPGIDGLPYKFYRWLRILFDEDTKNGLEGFDIVGLLVTLFSDIERYGIEKATNF
ncbi:hypothetical protein DFH09DRAFT_843143, partial [Mycena vulgaris]